MRRFFALGLLILGMFVLAGCGGNDSPSPTPEATLGVNADGQTLEDLIENATRPLDYQEPTSTFIIEDQPVINVTEEPTAGQLFDRLTITRSGGHGHPEYEIEIFSDGQLTFNGQHAQLPAHEINALQARFDEIGVYGIADSYQLWESKPDVFRYSFFIKMGDYSTSLEGENAYVPPQIRDIIGTVIEYSRYVGS